MWLCVSFSLARSAPLYVYIPICFSIWTLLGARGGLAWLLGDILSEPQRITFGLLLDIWVVFEM